MEKEVLRMLRKIKCKRIFLQLPEGLMPQAQRISTDLEKNGFECFICLEKTFGACDIREEEAKRLGCDCILNVGHSNYGIKTKLPVIYWEYSIDVNNLSDILEREFFKLNEYKRIGLVSNVQFVKLLPKVKKYLESKGKCVFVFKSLKYPGQILGCKQGAATAIENKVDCFLCISAGKFHALGVALATEKPVLNLDLEKRTLEDMKPEKDKIKKLEAWAKVSLKEAKNVGILVSWKVGQIPIYPKIKKIKKKLSAEGKNVYILVADEIKPEKLEGLKLDILINCACPRIALDDFVAYKIPIINVKNI